MDKIVWSYDFEDGSRLELTDSGNYYVLIEYDNEGKPVSYSEQQGYKLIQSDSVSYSKSDFSLDSVIADIEDMYDI